MIFIRDVIKAVAVMTRTSEQDLTGERRVSSLVMARFIAYHFSLRPKQATLTKVGNLFHRDHTSVLHGNRRMKQMIASVPNEWVQIEACYFRILTHILLLQHEQKMLTQKQGPT